MQSAQSAPTPPGDALNLSSLHIDETWSERGLSGLISAMEQCEPWAVDIDPMHRTRAEGFINQIVEALNAAEKKTVASCVSTDPESALTFMGYLRTGRALTLFSWLSSVHPSIPETLIREARAGESWFGCVLLERIATFEKQSLLSRVFGPERIALILDLLEESKRAPSTSV